MHDKYKYEVKCMRCGWEATAVYKKESISEDDLLAIGHFCGVCGLFMQAKDNID